MLIIYVGRAVMFVQACTAPCLSHPMDSGLALIASVDLMADYLPDAPCCLEAGQISGMLSDGLLMFCFDHCGFD